MKKKWENVWWFQIYFVPLHRQSDKAFFEILKQSAILPHNN